MTKFDNFIGWLVGLFITAFILLLGLCIHNDIQQDRAVKACYMQEHKTKECEFLLWKYENRDKTHAVAVPVFIHH